MELVSEQSGCPMFVKIQLQVGSTKRKNYGIVVLSGKKGARIMKAENRSFFYFSYELLESLFTIKDLFAMRKIGKRKLLT